MRLSRTVSALLEGARLHLDAWRMLRRERALWGVALVPFLASTVACTAALGAVVVYATPLHAFVTGWMPTLRADSVLSWLWVAPARAVLGIVGLVLFLAAAAGAVVLAFLSASVLSAPFLDALSRRVESLTQGTVAVAGAGFGGLLRDSARAAREELRRSVFFLLLQGTIILCGLVLPGGQVVAPPALVLATTLFLPLSYAAYTLDRRGVPFAIRRRWVLEHAATMLGFGGTAFLAFLVPGLNFLFLPVLVSSGTLLALRYPPVASRS